MARVYSILSASSSKEGSDSICLTGAVSCTIDDDDDDDDGGWKTSKSAWIGKDTTLIAFGGNYRILTG